MNKFRLLFGIIFCLLFDSSLVVYATKYKNENKDVNDSVLLVKGSQSNALSSNTSIKEKGYLNINSIPADVLYEICYKLKPVSIMKLSIASTHINKKFSDLFWRNYLLAHKQKIWEKPESLMKVAFSYSYFNEGRIEDAAALGLPEAIKLLDMSKNQKKEKLKTKIKNKYRVRISNRIESTNSIINYGTFVPFFGFPVMGVDHLATTSALRSRNR